MYFDEIITNKEIAIEKVKENGCALEKVSDELKDDKDVVLEAVKNNGYALEFASDRLKDDKDIAIASTIYDDYGLTFVNDDLKNELEQKLDSCKLSVLLDLYFKVLDSKEDVLNIIKHLKTTSIIANLLNAEQSELKLGELEDEFCGKYWLSGNVNSYILKYASDRLKDDKDIVIEAVKNNGFALEFASDRLKNDKEIVLEAVKQNRYSLRYAGKKFWFNPSIIKEKIKQEKEEIEEWKKREEEKRNKLSTEERKKLSAEASDKLKKEIKIMLLISLICIALFIVLFNH